MTQPRHIRKHILICASSADSDMLYATGFSCPDPFVFLRTTRGSRHLLMSDLEIDRARANSNARVHSMSALQDATRRRTGRAPVLADVITTFLRGYRIRRVAVPSSFPAGLADALRRRRITVEPLPDPFFPERRIKSAAEVGHIRRTMRAAEAGMRAAIEALRKSRIQGRRLVYRGATLTAERLRANIDAAVIERQCTPSGTIVAPGRQGCDPHERGHGVIRPNELVVIDIFPRSQATGYFADMTRTVVRGRASKQAKDMYAAVRAAHRLALATIRDGVPAREVHTAVRRLFDARGFATGERNGRMQGFFHGTGHGLGLDIHEPPRIGLSRDVLERGMVVTVEPGLYYEPVGGVRIEDTVLVTRSGVENLTRFPKLLEL